MKFDPAGPYTIRGGHAARGIGHQPLGAVLRKEIREAVGDRADLLFGTHGQFTPGHAIRLAEGIWSRMIRSGSRNRSRPDDIAGLAEVARGTSIPVAVGERLCGKMEFAAVLRAGVRIVQPALGRAGGILGGAQDRAFWPESQRRARSRRISMPGRWNGRRTCIWA